jgi:hypothetical protein
MISEKLEFYACSGSCARGCECDGRDGDPRTSSATGHGYEFSVDSRLAIWPDYLKTHRSAYRIDTVPLAASSNDRGRVKTTPLSSGL